ncbi:DUF2239 family protein [Variovorax sp. HJSM1_2]|uniref:DUF2239 family protein n=1 Tax=Variovorax sp. HJSM1_2 TaxID=3366263 RepID=UPI003BDC5F73
MPSPLLFTAFADSRCIAQGELAHVATLVKAASETSTDATLLLFHDADGTQVELDLRGTLAEVLQRLPAHPCMVAAAPLMRQAPVAPADTKPTEAAEAPRRPGRPRLGVVPREVTLLPRHWDWLNAQPGGASVVLRKLVEEARRQSRDADAARQAIEASYRFMQAMAGNAPNFEQASRALFAADTAALLQHCAGWPADVRSYMLRLAAPALSPEINTVTPPSKAAT